MVQNGRRMVEEWGENGRRKRFKKKNPGRNTRFLPGDKER
jgi:hypothetical protein